MGKKNKGKVDQKNSIMTSKSIGTIKKVAGSVALDQLSVLHPLEILIFFYTAPCQSPNNFSKKITSTTQM